MEKKTSLALVCLLAGLVFGLIPARSHAQITLDRYVPAPLAADGFIINRPLTTGHLKFGAIVYLEYAKNPVVWEEVRGADNTRTYPLVSDQLVVHPNVSLGLFDRGLVYLQLPINAVVSGDETARRATAVAYDERGSMGELKIGGRYVVYGEQTGPVSLGIQAGIGLPSANIFGSTGAFGAESSVTAFGQLLAEFRIERARINLNVGARFRQAAQIANLNINDELVVALGMSYPLMHPSSATKLEAFLEGFGSTLFNDVGGREQTPVETLAGLKLFTKSGMTGGIAGDLGLTAGYGSPIYRFIGMFGYAPMGNDDVEEPDADADGVPDSSDQCPNEPDDDLKNPNRDGCPTRDVDGDGLIEPADKCPRETEDKDNFEDDDGCPDADNDHDGLADGADKCPNEPEDKDGFEDEDGCPDPDNDHDGVLDADDKCPADAEDKDGFEDADGCPDLDNDKDGVPDATDKCPGEPENRDGKDDEDGCPDLARLDANNAQIVTLQPIRFAINRTEILPESLGALQQVASVLQSHPEIGLVSVEGHTDSQGNAGKNQKLSAGRAAAVRQYLIEQGLEPQRLVSEGFGSTVPIADNKTTEGRAKNRRVEFNIVPVQATGQ